MFASGYSGEWPTTNHDCFQTETISTNRFYGGQTSSSAQPEDYWRPGQIIPNVTNDIHAILSEMQHSIRREFDRLNRAMESFSDRLVDVENTVASHVVTMQSLSTGTPTSSPSSEEVGSGKRKRLVPTELQVNYNNIITCIAKCCLFQCIIKCVQYFMHACHAPFSRIWSVLYTTNSQLKNV